jgi:hypothetical protein
MRTTLDRLHPHPALRTAAATFAAVLMGTVLGVVLVAGQEVWLGSALALVAVHLVADLAAGSAAAWASRTRDHGGVLVLQVLALGTLLTLGVIVLDVTHPAWWLARAAMVVALATALALRHAASSSVTNP